MRRPTRAALAACTLTLSSFAVARATDDAASAVEFDWSFEAKGHYRDSSALRFASPFPFPPDFLPPGATRIFLETVDAGEHVELSAVTLFAGARWGEGVEARLKLDAVDRYDRNPTSSDREWDVDELWVRFGHDPATSPDRLGLYAKLGKFPHFERQNDRHLESYGLVSTAFNRFEDQGLEIGLDLGRHLYLRASATQGNPVFFRDPNALAGDNGTPELDPVANPKPNPRLKSGFPILYDAEVEDPDFGGDLELAFALGLRFGEPGSGRELNLLAWHAERDLQASVDLEGTFYGGDLDLLDGPFGEAGAGAGLPIRGDRKIEVGANLWLYWDGMSLFGQYVDQELAGMDRTGWEVEAAWRVDLPLVWAAGGRQILHSLQPAVRYSELEPEFVGGGPFPGPSVRWPWTKLDVGLRIGLVGASDLTVELADHEMTLANGDTIAYDELLATLRLRI
jgi:hypothetical protein